MSSNEEDIEQRVRRRAYELWEAAGRPNGRGDEFWHEAWSDITSGGEQEDVGSAAATPTPISGKPTTSEEPNLIEPTR